MNRRTDRVTALLVDAIVNVSASHGRVIAARSFAEAGVPLHIALRVLTRPWERRTYRDNATVPTDMSGSSTADAP